MTPFALPNAAGLTVCADAGALAHAVAHRLAGLIRSMLVVQGHCRIALAGGETPRRTYAVLRELPIEWRCVEVYFGDERCLPPGAAGRNDTLAHAALLAHVAIPPGHVHAIPAELGARAAAANYSGLLAQAGALDIVLLGMGEDGHTASLFPGNPALHDQANAVAVFDAPKPPPERVSLGLATLNATRHKLFLVGGSGKRDVLRRIVRGEPLPAAQIRNAEWYLDRDAIPTA